MRTFIISLVLLLSASPSLAQTPRPQIATTLQTTDTTVNSVIVGCALGSLTCTGGIKAGQVSLSAGMALDGATISDAGIVFANAVPANTAFALYRNGSNLEFNGAVLAAGSSISGTQYTIAMFSASNAVGDSMITQNSGGTLATVTGTLTAMKENGKTVYKPGLIQ